MPHTNPYINDHYEGWPVVGAKAVVSNVASALTRSLIADPERWQLGDTVLLIVRADVTDISHPAISANDPDRLRKHHLRATDVTVLPSELHESAITAIAEQMDRNRRASEERDGTQRLEGL